jgi:RNA polymerase sigma-70 factor (ECF subfamily)
MNQNDFLALVTPLQARLFRTAYRLLLNEEEAKDVIQDVFLKLWKKREEMGKYQNLEAWCITVTKNTALDRIKYNRLRTVKLSAALNQSDSHLPIIENSFEIKDMLNITRRILNELPEKQRLLVHLRDIEGLAYETIAEIMNISAGEVKIGLFRARSVIRDQIKKINSYGIP